MRPLAGRRPYCACKLEGGKASRVAFSPVPDSKINPCSFCHPLFPRPKSQDVRPHRSIPGRRHKLPQAHARLAVCRKKAAAASEKHSDHADHSVCVLLIVSKEKRLPACSNQNGSVKEPASHRPVSFGPASWRSWGRKCTLPSAQLRPVKWIESS